MNQLRKQIRKVVEDELAEVTRAVQAEVELRQRLTGAIAESIERRAAQRLESYRQARREAMVPERARDSQPSQGRRAA